jgi:hypothetical protein
MRYLALFALLVTGCSVAPHPKFTGPKTIRVYPKADGADGGFLYL